MLPFNPRHLKLRVAMDDDFEFLWWLHLVTMKDYVDKTYGWDEQFQRARFREAFRPAERQVIEYLRAPVGMVEVSRNEDEILLAAIEVAPDFQRRGIGTELISRILAEADQTRKPVRLQVMKVNPARALYDRLGFRCAEETATHFVMKRVPYEV